MADEPREKKPDVEFRVYREDEELREVQENPDRRMTREEWEQEESRARQAAHKKHEQVLHDREVQQEYDRKHRKRNWKKILPWAGLALACLALIFLVGWIPRHRQQKRAKELAREREQEVPQVQVVQAVRAKLPGALTVPGTTSAQTVAYIYARANGYVRKRYADIGDHVKKGQVLALIDAPDLDQQVQQAREQLRQAQAQEDQQRAQLALNRVTWERYRVLAAKGVFSRQDADQQEANYNAQIAVVDSAHRNVESYRANLGRLIALQSYERVTAPFDGVITERNFDLGALVGTTGAAGTPPMLSSQQDQSGGTASTASSNTSGMSGQMNNSATPQTGSAQGGALFAIAQFDVLRILVSVPEGYAQSIRDGMPAAVYIQERSGQPIQGSVTRTADSLDQNTRTMLAEVDVANRDGALYPGMYAVVSFTQVHGVPPLIIPGDAVVVRKDRTSVATVHDEKIHLSPVEIGRDYGPEVEIVSGLNEGEWVVATVTDAVQEGVKVRPQKQAGAGESNGGGAQTNAAPESGPNQYGDQSVVNSQTENTTQKKGPQQRQTQQQEQKMQDKSTKKGAGQ